MVGIGKKLFWIWKKNSYHEGKWVKCWSQGSVVTSYLLLLNFIQLIIVYNIEMSTIMQNFDTQMYLREITQKNVL